MDVIETRELKRHYRRTRAVDGIDLRVPEGATVVLVGANGAGKTTTLEMLVGLIAPSGGEARVLGQDCRRLTQTEFRRIGYASENQLLPDYLTLDAWFDYLRAFYPSWERAREIELRERFDLPAGRRIKSLSRGERMKACSAAAMAFSPALLIMDEPLSGLDPVSREELVRALAEQAGDGAMLISSHDLNDVDRLASHVALMHAGKLVVQEETEALTARFREVTLTLPGDAAPGALAPSWILPKRSGGLFGFVETAFSNEVQLRRELVERFGPAADPSIDHMSLATISGAIIRDAQGQTPRRAA